MFLYVTCCEAVRARSLAVLLFLSLFSFSAVFVPANDKVLRVPSEYKTIQEAIDATEDGDTVLVASWVYTGEGNRGIDFSGKSIMVKSEEGPNQTIIDCGGFPHKGFSFHTGEGKNSVVEGFTVRRGSGIDCDGSSPTIRNCIIENNSNSRGGGIACWHNADPLIVSCTITRNWAQYSGGGIHCTYCSPRIVNCTITANICEIGYGGGIACGATAEIANCLIAGNSAGGDGAGVACYYSEGTPRIVNCTIVENRSVHGGAAVGSFRSDPQLVNCILWNRGCLQLSGSTMLLSSDVLGGCTGEANIDSEPEFTRPGRWDDNGTPGEPDDDSWVEGDYHLTSSSPCVDEGDNSLVSEWLVTDMDGGSRTVDGDADGTATVDMGFDEYEGP